MADSPISALPDVDTLGGVAGVEFLPFARGSQNGKLTPQQLWMWIDETYGPFASSVSLNNVTPETHPSTAAAADDEFEAGTSIDTTGGRRTGATPWSWVNRGTATAIVSQGALVFTAPASSSEAPRLLTQPLPAGSGATYRCKMLDLVSASADSSYAGLAFYDATEGKAISVGVHALATGWQLEVDKWPDFVTAPTAAYTSGVYPTTGRVAHQPIWLEITTDGTTLRFLVSDSGVDGTFEEVFSETISTYLPTVSHVALLVDTSNSVPALAVYDLFRQIA